MTNEELDRLLVRADAFVKLFPEATLVADLALALREQRLRASKLEADCVATLAPRLR